MKEIILICGLSFGAGTFSQNELINTFSSEFEFYPGVDGIGYDRSESYTFVAFDKVELLEIFLDDQPIILDKGDTIIISSQQHIPQERYFEDGKLILDTSAVKIVQIRDRYRVHQYREIIYATVLWPYAWDGNVLYKVDQREFVAKIKEGFDESRSDGAP